MSAFTDASLLIATTTGTVRGAHDGQTHRWRGIPYAADPIGDLRLRSPQPHPTWEGVRDALEFGNVAPQEETKVIPIPTGLSIAEDCLSLNIWAPVREDGDTRARPVMVWIHGGAYFIGFSAQKVYNGRSLVENGDVIVVTINYRLGALGFLDFSSFGDETHVFDSNLGLRDIIAALTWVQENIAAFGGDPDDVTLFGESAGGGCVTALMTSPKATGLFHKAIAQSSPASSVYGRERAKSVAGAYLDIIGVPHSEAKVALREMDAQTLAASTMTLLDHIATTVPGSVAFAPVVDGDVITDYPINIFRAGGAARIPLMIGTNHDEAALFKMMKSPLMPISEAAIHEMFDLVAQESPELAHMEGQITAAYKAYPKQKGAMEISRDAGFRMPSIWVAEAHSRLAPTFMYRFDTSPPLMRLLGIGASHATELPYVFGNLPKKVTKKDISFRLGGLKEAQAISARMQAHWLAFATTGDPATPEGAWPAYDEATRTTLIIDTKDGVENDPEGEIRSVWGEGVIGFK